MTVSSIRVAGRLRRWVLAIGVGLLLSACGPATGPIGAAPTPTPTPNTLNLSLWTISTVGTGPTATQAGDGVDFLIPAGSTQDPQKHYLAAGLGSKCKLTGDFDLQLDYSLIAWPPRNSVRLGLAAGNYSVGRSSNKGTGPDNMYLTDFDTKRASAGTEDLTGRLRLTRVGTSMTGYYRHNGAWVMITSAKGPTEATSYAIAAWTDYDTVVASDVRVKVTHFTVVPAPAACP